MSIYQRDELSKPINETLFGPMRKKLSPLPDSPEKSKGQPEKKREEETKDEGRVEKHKKKQPEETTSRASETEESTWKMVKIDAPTNDIDEGPPSLRLRLGAMVDEFFDLTALLHGHHPRKLCDACKKAKRQLITAIYTQDPRLLHIPTLEVDIRNPRL